MPDLPKPDFENSPALNELWKTLATAQAGLDLRRADVVKDLAELDAQEQHWTAEADKAWDADRAGDHQHALAQLQACRQLRTQLMHDLGPDPERYGVTPEQTLDPAEEQGSAVMRSIEATDVRTDPGSDGQDGGQQ